MPGPKQMAVAMAAIAGLLFVPVTNAVAAGPLLFAPLVLGHVLGAAARLATLPLALTSAAASQQQTSYPPSAGYYAPPNDYARPPMYYPAPQAYYPPVRSYAQTAPRYYAPPRGYYAAPTRYSGYYGAQASYRSRGFSYRRR
jgi:hypothetical protein